MPEFPCATPVHADITMAAGLGDITCEERESVHVDVSPYEPGDRNGAEVAAATEVRFDGDRLTVRVPEAGIGWLFKRQPALRITVKLPSGSSVNAKSASADLISRGQSARVQLNSGSGSLSVADAHDIGVNTASGDVKVMRGSGSVHANSASGDIEIDHADGEVNAKSASGDIRVGYAGAKLSATTASGDVLVRHGRRGVHKVRTVSGSVSIGVAKGTGVWLDLSTTSGRTSSDLSVGDTPTGNIGEPDLNLQVRTISGDIEVLRTPE